jgi:release factor glutamine methyltransferase
MTAVGKSTIRNTRLDFELVAGLRIVVLPEVFNPVRMRSGEFLASVIDSDLIGHPHRVLDMGTGSGVCAVIAARRAQQVVAVDINTAAVRCAQLNARRNRSAHKLDVRQGDLFAPVAGERFDLILFNPPFLLGAPQSNYDRAWRSVDVVPRFAACLGQHLNPGGKALVLLSTYGNSTQMISHFSQSGMVTREFATRHYDNETLTIYQVTAAS